MNSVWCLFYDHLRVALPVGNQQPFATAGSCCGGTLRFSWNYVNRPWGYVHRGFPFNIFSSGIFVVDIHVDLTSARPLEISHQLTGRWDKPQIHRWTGCDMPDFDGDLGVEKNNAARLVTVQVICVNGSDRTVASLEWGWIKGNITLFQKSEV